MTVYQANFLKGSLMIPESRIIARLLLTEPIEQDWRQAILEENVLQKRAINTAKTHAGIIRQRLQTMPKGLWQWVANGSSDTASQAMLAATVKFSPLLGDFMLLILKDLYQSFQETVPSLAWQRYIDDRRQQEPGMPQWADTTHGKLRQNTNRILHEAGFLTDTKTLTLRRVFISPEVLSCLKEHREAYALSCLQVCA